MADAHLYGVRAPKNQHKPIESSTALAFSSQLSSLISKESSKSSSTRSRDATSAAKSKTDIFSAHKSKNNSKKRTHDEYAAGSSSQSAQKHQTQQELGGSLTSSDLARSRRKMEEKARLYAAMKRGDYVAPTGSGPSRDDQANSLIDFDRKWAEQASRGSDLDNDSTSSGDDDETSDTDSLHSYTDDLGRTRHLPRRTITRLERDRRIAANFAQESESLSARPSMPTTLIYGDTVQSHAFNPDAVTATKMSELASKRDRSATPPPSTHYNANSEIRTKGTGFYAFSQDKEGREAEFGALEKERRDTEQARKQQKGKRNEERERRKKAEEERRRILGELKGKKRAERFLEELGSGLGMTKEGAGGGEGDPEEAAME